MKKALVGFLVLLVGIGGAFIIYSSSAKTKQNTTSPAYQKPLSQLTQTYDNQQSLPVIAQPKTSQTTSRYVVYSQVGFNAAKDKRRVLYFHAPWCPTCRPLDKALTDNPNQIPEGVVVFKTDYDTETALKTKYGVTYQHTFIEVNAAGNAVQTWSGGDVADIVAKLQ